MARPGLLCTLALLGLLGAPSCPASALLAGASGAAPPTARDAAASADYLHARQRVMRATLSDMPAGLARLRRYDAAFDSECAGVLSGAPSATTTALVPGGPAPTPGAKAAGEFWIEALLVSVRELLAPAEPALIRAAHATSRLRWSSPRLTRLVRRAAREELAEAQTPLPELCADARAWAASGFRETSPATRRLVARAISSAESTQEVIGRSLRRYEDRSGRALARRLQSLEEGVSQQLLGDSERARP